MSILKPEGSLTLGAATAAVVYAAYTFNLPNVATMTATLPHDSNIDSARKRAAWTSAGAVIVVSVLAKDKTIFVLGGLTLMALDWHARHANGIHPETGKTVSATPKSYMPAQQAAQAPATPSYAGFAM
jgi:hypothetical protein